MGQRALNQDGLAFDEVRIHEKHLLTDTTLHEFMLQRTLALAAASMGAIFTGVARAAYEAALDAGRQADDRFVSSRSSGRTPRRP